MKKSLRQWCNENNLEYLLEQWMHEENLPMLPDNVSYGSNKKVWWKCPKCSNIWKTKIYSRTSGYDCPKCGVRKRLDTYIEKNGSLYDVAPQLIREWYNEKNNGLLITQVTPSSNKKVWWICKEGHIWEASPATRLKGHGCPVCSGMIVLKEKSLAVRNTELAKEWHPTKNGNLTPYDVGAYSHKKVWWVCKRGHEWQQTVSNRNQGRGCAKCSSELKTSFPEQAILYYLSQELEVGSRCKINDWECDIFLPQYNIAIEYDGIIYHSQNFIKDREKRKNQAFNEKNIDLIRVKESYDREGIEGNTIYFIVDSKYKQLNKALNMLFSLLEQKINYKFVKKIDVEKDRLDIINGYYKLEKKNNFSIQHPELILFWNYEKNLNLKPENFKSKSNEKVWWKCPKCNGEWMESIINVSKKNRCPYCSGHRVLKGFNDLETINPELAKEWHQIRNTISPDNVTAGSNKKVWWICNKCNYNWRATVNYRMHHSNCPNCSGANNRNILNYYKNERWMKMYNYAKQYYTKHGELKIPAKYVTEDGAKLGSWIRTQRVSFKNGDLTEERLSLLKNIGMVWEIEK